LRPLLLNQSVELIFEDAGDIPVMFSDEGKISQILRNFLSNGLKFTERGELRVSAALAGDGEVRFCVSDTGIGIAKDHQDLIFQDFAQIDGPIQRRVKGTGLGLPLCRNLAGLLGGSVGVRSEPGAGSTFTLQIPLRYQETGEPQAPFQTDAEARPAGVPILVVEDSPEMLMVYDNFFRGSGFQLLPARTTREAEEILDSIKPCAVVLDVVLRSEDSWGFLAHLKSDPATAEIPVLIVSTVEDQGKACHRGADGYQLKPVQRWELVNRLNGLTGQQAVSRILIIDDDAGDRYVLKQQLRDFSFLITEASDGIEGFRKACEETPDLVLLDLGMPGMNGFEVLTLLRAEPATASIPVIISTSRMLTESERRQLKDKVIAVVNKESFRGGFSHTLRRSLNDAGLTATPQGV
jgi:CheY-like chemotaxis protein